MQAHFISDLHLSADRPGLTELFERYLDGAARAAAQLYILGDLFEYWCGDDDLDDPLNARIAARLAALAEAGCAVFFMAGNRDLLIGADFARRAGLTLLPEPSLVTLGEERFILCHGDNLCTDDQAYQAYRAQVREPVWQAGFMAQPLAARKHFIAGLRVKSEAAKSGKSAEIMDVNSEAVAALVRDNAFAPLIHGHTHRPAVHAFAVDGHPCQRWVLADWRDDDGLARGEVLVWEDGKLSRQAL